MTDMLVRLYPDPIDERPVAGIRVVRAMAADREAVCGFVRAEFGTESPGWIGECEAAVSCQPATCLVGISEAREVVGFCCYDATARGMAGPVGVRGDMRGRGLARELLRQTFEAMRQDGYAYAVIGWVSDEAFYARLCGAVPIEGSHPGIFARSISQGV